MAVKKRRGNRSKVWAIPLIIVVAGVLIAGVVVDGGKLGLFHSTPASSSSFSVLNVTMSTYPAIDDGYTGVSVAFVLANHASSKLVNASVVINSLTMGTCSTLSGTIELAPGASANCKIGVQVNCNSFPTPPYAVDVTAKFATGPNQSNTVNISSPLTTTC